MGYRHISKTALRLVADLLDRSDSAIDTTTTRSLRPSCILVTVKRFGRLSIVKADPSSTRKKVVLRKLNKELIKGYVDPRAYLEKAQVEVLDREGRLVSVPIEEVKGVYFVREFDGNRERAERKAFLSRPKLEGLWVRLTFKDSEVLEGMIANDLLALDSRGFLVTPSDFYSNNLRIFVPRSALSALEVLGAISNDAARRAQSRAASARRRRTDTTAQIRLFPPSPSAESK